MRVENPHHIGLGQSRVGGDQPRRRLAGGAQIDRHTTQRRFLGRVVADDDVRFLLVVAVEVVDRDRRRRVFRTEHMLDQESRRAFMPGLRLGLEGVDDLAQVLVGDAGLRGLFQPSDSAMDRRRRQLADRQR